ncbi:hypothetical protein [Desulfovibrio gilichinskyi]|uniref:CS1 type fimbrial major subunit n=1 Tax=Desulfovibrio gilichinskyi TaxID=1519643 RepID=A0A1X7CJH0_9BACT|nr:hypothetical protein [Desulfovibrio gilichinskyi]SME97898.1 hypothetical protein SAMN06295933_0989 [Desulfovibrio gilichinskyi]
MKKIVFLLTCSALLCASMAFAENANFQTSITLAQPFSIDSTANADFGTLYTTGSAETITMNVVPIVPTTAATVVLISTGASKPTLTTGEIIRGTSAPVALTTQLPGIIYVKATQANVDLAVSLVGTPTLDKGFYTGTATPITVSGITTNVTAFNSLAITAADFATLMVGPVLSVPAAAETGTYTGTVTVDVTAI